MRSLIRLGARLLAGVTVLAVMAVPVVAVAYAAGNPIPADLLDRLAARTVDDTTIIKILSLGFYVCWAWFCGPAVRHVSAVLRHTPRPARHADGDAPSEPRPASRPLQPVATGPRGLLARLALFAVSGAAVAASVTSPRPAAVAAAPPVAVAATVSSRDAASSTVTSEVTSVLASHRDTPYAVARAHFPADRVDAARDEIVELNTGRPLPDGSPYRGGGFPAGWSVLIPSPAAPVTAPDDGAVSGDPLVVADPATADSVDTGPSGVPTHVVGPDESYWSIGEDHLRSLLGREPDGAEVVAYTYLLMDANAARLGHDDPQMLYVDDIVHLVAPTPTPTVSGAEPVVGHVVSAGESYWSIAEAQLRVELGREPTKREVLVRTEELIAVNAPRLGYDDPAMLRIGDIVDPAAPAPAAPVAADQPPPPVADPLPAPPLDVADPVPPALDDLSPAAMDTAPASLPATSIPTSPPLRERSPRSVPASTGRGEPPTVDRPPTDTDVDGLFDSAPRTVWWSVPTGVLLAAGLTMMARRLRGRRLAQLEPGEQLVAPPAVAAGTEAAVSSGAPQRRLSTLQALLRTVTPYAREHADPPPVRAVEIDADRVEVLFAEPAPFPPPGWTTINGGVSWVHRLEDSVTPAVRQLVTPALVTVGLRAGDGEVLLDLETAGSLAITGDHGSATGLARAMALEVATYPLGVAMDVCLIGFDVDGLENCDRAWKHTTLTRAVRVAREVLERTAATGAVSLMAARAETDDDDGVLDPQIFIVDTAAVTGDDVALVDELVGLCTPQSGAVTVLIGDHPDARERIEVLSADRARWFDAELRPTLLDREAVAQAAVMLDHAANAPAEPVTPSPLVARHLVTVRDEEPPDDDGGGDDDDGDGVFGPDVAPVAFRYVPPDHDVLVQVLGEVTVHGRPVVNAVDVELLALLVCQRHKRPNVDVVMDLLGRDNAKGTVQKRVSRLRARLGVGSDGADLLPLGQPGRGSLGRYVVSDRVMTDVELIEHRYHTAMGLASGDALPVLREGLELFTGPAFRARTGYSWAGPEDVLQRISTTVNAYAALLMQLAFDADDIPLVLETAGRAGRVIDDPVGQFPLRDLERQLAEACGDPALAASVQEARLRLRAYVNDVDRLAPD